MAESAVHSVVITGGASGIGAALARRVIDEQGYVGIIDINPERIEACVSELGQRATGYQVDVSDFDALTQVHEELAARMPAINGLVNCAGAPPIPTPIEEQSVTEWERVLDSHIKTTYVACKVFGSAMASRGHGAIVNTSSVLAFRPGPVLDYGPGKAGIVSLTQSLAVHWATKGVRVNAVAPGWTDTPFLRPPERKGERDLTPILNATPMRRVLQPEEIANAIFFLLSSQASAITGVTLPCDGGMIAGSGWAPYGGVNR